MLSSSADKLITSFMTKEKEMNDLERIQKPKAGVSKRMILNHTSHTQTDKHSYSCTATFRMSINLYTQFVD